MLKHSLLTVKRIGQFVDRFVPMIHPEKITLEGVEVAGPVERIPYEQAVKLKFRPAKAPIKMDPYWSTWWFRVRGTVPSAWRKKPIDFVFRTYGECLAWQKGEPIGGMNWDGGTPFKDEGRIRIRLKDYDASGKFEIYVEASASGLFGLRTGAGTFEGDNPFKFDLAELELVDVEAWDLYHDLFVPNNYLQLGGELTGNSWTRPADQFPLDAWRGYLMEQLNEICNLVSPEDPKTWKAAYPILKKIYAHKNASFGHEISAIGHAHIDTAWLWPLAESVRKCARTFSTAVTYMDEYPEYRFSCSQAHQYQWTKDKFPGLYEKVKKKVKAGQFIPVGGTWIEPDCVVPSGESLVRQFLYGKQFFRREFGIDIKEFWNPDVFGYSGQLPQIMRGVGIDSFLTQKLSWNQFNKPKNQNFDWEGIDGTRVFTHFPPADTYNAMTGNRILADLLHQGTAAMDHERTNQGMLLYGYGDGGGGPTRHMLEVLKRVKDFQGIPRTVQRTAQEFFKKLKANIRDVNVIKGELYFELHRGTYTSQAANKKGNRDSERVLREVEMLASLSGSEYPSAELERLWKIVLLNQFHDILPGSSINEVYQDSAKDYAEVKKSLGELRKSALKNLLRSGEETIIVNTCGWKRTGLIELGKDAKVLPSAIAQKSHDGKIIAEVSAPSVGTARLGMDKASGKIATLTHKKNLYVLENDFIVAEFLASGSLIRLQEKKSGREMIENGESANQFVLFDDRPVAWDAWDVDPFHLETRKPIPAAKSVKVLENGPLRVGLEFFYSFGKSGKSSLSQKVFLENRSGVLAFDNELDWHEQHQFLKVEFPVAVKSMDASYEIQFGHLKRATHFNTSFEVARFEANAHKWIDLSEPEFGVSLFTDCKYGYAVHDSTMRISLVRGPTSPDPMADQGKHHFRFACYPHAGDLIQAETVRRAHEFNQPWISVQGSGEEKSFVSVSSPHLVIDTVKKSEVGNALIVRLYETHGARGKATLKVPTGFKKASLVNLMEEQAKPVSLSSDVLTFKFRAFEVITVKLEK